MSPRLDAAGRWLLYDNLADPYQLKNLVADPAHQAMMAALDKHILAWQTLVGDAFQFSQRVGKCFVLSQLMGDSRAGSGV